MNFDDVREKWRKVDPALQSFVVGGVLFFVFGFVVGMAVCSWVS